MRAAFAFALACTIAVLVASPGAAQLAAPWRELPGDLPNRYAVIGVEVEPAAPDTLRIRRVRHRSPAAVAGLRPGDLVMAADGCRVRTAEEFGRYTRSLPPGSNLRLEILRQGQPLSLGCGVTDRRHLYFLMGEQGRAPPQRGDRHREWSAGADSLERAARRLLAETGAGGVLDSLKAAFALEARHYAADCRLADVDYLLHHPLKAGAVAGDLAAGLASAPDLAARLAAAAAHLDLDSAAVAAAAGNGQSMAADWSRDAEIMRLAMEPLARACHLAEAALARLDSAEQAWLRSHAPCLLERFGRSFYLDRGDSAETESHIRTLRLAKEVNLAALIAAARALAPLATPQRRRALRRAVRHLEPGAVSGDLPGIFGGDFLFAAPTPWGWVLVGDRGANVYAGDALFVLDLGGDDLYACNAGAPSLVASHRSSAAGDGPAPPPSLQVAAPVGVVIDLHGNDRYIAHGPGAAGGALGGVGLLVDAAGDDLYEGGLLSQGAAFCGVGVLVDEAGDDTYLGQESTQGAAYFGLGLLIDESGDDLYSGTQFAQGFGGPRGLGLLLDRRGHDRYLVDRAVPSGYGTAGVYEGWAQGAGCGFRGYAAGGVGLLVDEAGADEYRAGNFSQGMGYFFSLGVLVDGRGNDRYWGTRYTQGASAHQAVGALLDRDGDDRYRGRIAANQGGAWDVGVAILDDAAGDDEYRAEGMAQGAAAMNGLAVLLDRRGADRYEAHSGQAHGGGTSYWGGRQARNLGLLIDAGGAIDRYALEGRGDRLLWRGGNVGIFADE